LRRYTYKRSLCPYSCTLREGVGMIYKYSTFSGNKINIKI